MRNLDKFGVQTLSTQEMRETDGGFIDGFLVVYILGKLVDRAIQHPEDWGGVNRDTYKLGHVGGGRP